MKKFLSVILVLALTLALAACGKSDDQSKSEKDSKNAETQVETSTEEGSKASSGEIKKIGHSVPTLGAEFFTVIDEQIKALCDVNGIELVTLSYESSSTQQIADIENLVTMGCDSIIVWASDTSSLNDVCKQAMEAGVRIYPVGSVLTDRSAFTGSNNTDQYESGTNCAEMAADWINEVYADAEDGSVGVVILGNVNSEEATKRTTGMQTIADLSSKVTLLETYNAPADAQEQTWTQENIELALSKYDNVDVILCYGVGYELPANEVMMRECEDPSKVAVFGVDTSVPAYELIKESVNNTSVLRGTVSLGDDLAGECFQLATGKWDDKMNEDGVYLTHSTKVDTSNVDEYLNK